MSGSKGDAKRILEYFTLTNNGIAILREIKVVCPAGRSMSLVVVLLSLRWPSSWRHYSGIEKILALIGNQADIEVNVPDSVKEGIEIVYVEELRDSSTGVFMGEEKIKFCRIFLEHVGDRESQEQRLSNSCLLGRFSEGDMQQAGCHGVETCDARDPFHAADTPLSHFTPTTGCPGIENRSWCLINFKC
ncbi:hypothetical protein DFH28DRAFT_939991 [Melampsora americana]|nr:hypothetical protein DFH28DRAFT_939991 [Melampsora americana]